MAVQNSNFTWWMRYSITLNLRIYQRIEKNMFSIGKNGVLNPLEILRMLNKFWCEYLYRLFDVLPRLTCKIKTLRVRVYFQQWFHDEQGAKFISRLTFLVWLGHEIICWRVALFVRVSEWGQVVEINFSLIKFECCCCWELFLSLPAEPYIIKMHCSWYFVRTFCRY